jgi:hypothetical protein
MKANGKYKEKAFKLRELKLDFEEEKTITKKHSIKNTSGRIHYLGVHFIELQINGVRYEKVKFEIV